MKDILFLIITFFFFGSPAQMSSKEKFRLGFKLGGATTNVTGGRVGTHSKGGLIAGPWFQMKMSKNLAIQAELIFVGKGAGGFHANQPPIPGEYLLGLWYIEMPVLFQYRVKKFNFELGPGIGVLLSQFEILNGALYPDMTNTYPFTKNEFSFNVGLGYSFNEKWYLGLRFTHSILPVRKQLPEISSPVYNRVFGITVARHLNFRNTKSKHAE